MANLRFCVDIELYPVNDLSNGPGELFFSEYNRYRVQNVDQCERDIGRDIVDANVASTMASVRGCDSARRVIATGYRNQVLGPNMTAVSVRLRQRQSQS